MTRLSILLDEIDSGTVLLPEFQRGYVWNRDQVRGLLRSLYLEHPVGGLLFWETASGEVAVRGEAHGSAGPRRLLLDGQQRVTTMYGVIRGTPPPFFEGDPKAFSGLYFDVENELFEFYSPTKMRKTPTWVDVTELFQRGPMGYMRRFSGHDEFDDERLDLYLERLNKLKQVVDREFNEEKITGTGRSVDEVVDIFNRVNSGGTKLSKGDLALASLCARWPEARQELRDNLERWRGIGFDFSLDWLLRNVTAVATGRSVFDALGKISPEEFQRALRSAVGHIDLFLDTVSNRLGLDHAQVLMGSAPIHVVSRLLELNDGRFDDDAHRDKVLYWYVHASLWGRHTSSAETFLQRDYDAAQRGGITALITSLRQSRGGKLVIRPDDFTGQSRGARFYPLLYMMSRLAGARDLDSGLELTAENLGEDLSLEVHNIFPNDVLRKHGYDRSTVYTLANFCILPQHTAESLKKLTPAEYLSNVQRNRPGALESQWIPTDPNLWRLDRYPQFIEARRKLFTAAAQMFLEKLRDGILPAPLLRPVQIAAEEPNPTTARVTALVDELLALGYARPVREAEIADPATGRELVVADACWPDGLQHGIGDPVAMILEPGDADLSRLTEIGFRVFTSVEALHGHAEHRAGSFGEETGISVGEPAPLSEETRPNHIASGAAPASENQAAEFGHHISRTIVRCHKEAGYRANHFLRMVAELGAVEAVRKLLAAPAVSEGFSTLWEVGRLDLTAEAAVLDGRFSTLFDEHEREIARRRLEQFGFVPDRVAL
ncbi:DUF262 domain-containing protein [Nocardia flavorosea]|uniref:GmrSD restriction endonuclease domain-containing protein n=1 Tax=Nocardia flavorosea TaxID=53429 RepID=UPI0018952468|nr:DUF262 domain-containing protein [Nocardia flavorosea]MBF6352800.1 DUF262 domain-containing protein [Nocardia flavorosea]